MLIAAAALLAWAATTVGGPAAQDAGHAAGAGASAGATPVHAPAPGRTPETAAAGAVATPWSGIEITVGTDGDVATIRAALDIAADGDRIRILSGTYAEGVLEVGRSVEIVGDGWPVLDAGGVGALLRVTADGVAIRGLVLRGTGVSHVADHAAILFDGVTGCTAEGNRLEDNFFGIYIARSSGCTVRGNEISGHATREINAGNGVHLWNASDVLVEDNAIRGQRDGVYLEHVRGAVIRRNTSERNLRYGLHFMFSSDAEYERNVFRDNGAGVAVMYSKNVRMAGNVFADNWGATAYGLLLKEITDSEVTENVFRGNTVGINSDGSARLQVTGNRFLRNGWAVRVLANSRGNTFAGNDFIENTFDVSTNSRQSFNTFSGNYWSRYAGYDLDADGTGDVPHRPVRLFALIVEKNPAALMLLRGAFVDLLDIAERVVPVLTPEALVDERPSMKELVR
jgi:nitrous oxidase accessory protein